MRRDILEQVGRLLGSQVGQNTVGHQRLWAARQLFDFVDGQTHQLLLGGLDHDFAIGALDDQSADRAAVGSDGAVSPLPRGSLPIDGVAPAA